MASAFRAGRLIEKANHRGVILDGLQKFIASKENSKNAAIKSKEKREESVIKLQEKVKEYARDLIASGVPQCDRCGKIQQRLKNDSKIDRTTVQIRNDLKKLNLWERKNK